jgi:hypothetical protein
MGREALAHEHDQTALAQLAAGWALLARDLSGSLAALGLPGGEDFYLRGDGSWAEVAGGLEWEYQNGAYQAEDKSGVLADTSAGQWTLTLPDDPDVGMEVGVVDVARSFDTHSLLVDAGGHLIEGVDEVLECDVHASAFTLVYASAEQGWVINQMAFAAPVDGAVDTPSLRTLGVGALQAAAGNDGRLSDSRTPTAHKASHATGGIGYATGAGAAQTQTGSRTSTVIVNAAAGAITLVSAAGSTSPQAFTVTNSAVAATDVIVLSQKSGTDKYDLSVTAVGAGSFEITHKTHSGTTTEQPVINFAVIKAVAA